MAPRRTLLLAVTLLLNLERVEPACAVEKNTGSAQPYVGHILVGPFVLKRPDGTMIVEAALRFKPEVDERVRSAVMDKTTKDVLRMRLYEASMTSFLDLGRRIDRKELRERLMREVDRLLTFEGTEDIAFTRFEFR